MEEKGEEEEEEEEESSFETKEGNEPSERTKGIRARAKSRRT